MALDDGAWPLLAKATVVAFNVDEEFTCPTRRTRISARFSYDSTQSTHMIIKTTSLYASLAVVSQTWRDRFMCNCLESKSPRSFRMFAHLLAAEREQIDEVKRLGACFVRCKQVRSVPSIRKFYVSRNACVCTSCIFEAYEVANVPSVIHVASPKLGFAIDQGWAPGLYRSRHRSFHASTCSRVCGTSRTAAHRLLCSCSLSSGVASIIQTTGTVRSIDTFPPSIAILARCIEILDRRYRWAVPLSVSSRHLQWHSPSIAHQRCAPRRTMSTKTRKGEKKEGQNQSVLRPSGTSVARRRRRRGRKPKRSETKPKPRWKKATAKAAVPAKRRIGKRRREEGRRWRTRGEFEELETQRTTPSLDADPGRRSGTSRHSEGCKKERTAACGWISTTAASKTRK